jgi:NADH-quinone oxidoreductase subunit H
MSILPEIFNRTPALATLAPDWPGGFWWHWLVFTIIIIACVLLVVIGMVTAERRFIGFFQARHGPNRTGPFGVLQLIADGIKGMLKEDIIPDRADKLVYWLAPVITFFPTFLLFAVIPFGDRAVLADLNVGILFFLAVGSISTVGIFMAGWGSNNKYAVISALRIVASVVSYEIPVILSVVGVILISGSLSLNQIVVGQNIPYILYQPLGFVLFFIGGCAEVARSPFDLMEADSEIVAGYHTDYSGMKYLAFMIAEYCEALGIAAVISIFFLSGWKGPGLLPWIWLLIKICVVFFVMIWIRATVPRVRIDQLMALAWKFLLPLSIINLIITAVEVLVWPDGLPWITILINIAVMVILILVWSRLFKLGWGKIETGKIRDRYC